jgi:hypothetical protein
MVRRLPRPDDSRRAEFLLPNYAPLIFELSTSLAEFEGRQASEVIDDILPAPGRDLPDGASSRPGRQADVARR